MDLVPLLQIHHNELDDNPQYSKKILVTKKKKKKQLKSKKIGYLDYGIIGEVELTRNDQFKSSKMEKLE